MSTIVGSRTALDVLRDARALIATPDKWAKGSAEGWGGRYCAIEAIGTATRPDAECWSEARNAIMKVTGTATVFQWNDHPQTTHADVLEAFDSAIASLEAEATR